MSISRSVFLSWLLLCAALFAQAPQQHTFYVNGITGTDTPSSGYEGFNWDPSSTVPPAPNGYRTIRYAIQQALPYVAAASGNVVACAKIYVQGGQVYSAATNGEVFPIQQESAIGLEGTFVGLGYSAYPVLQPPAGVAALTFSATQSFNGKISVSGTLFSSNHYRYLEFRGGSHAATMGASPPVMFQSFRHRPRFEDCIFINQTVSGIRIDQAGSAIDDPKIYRNTFTGSTATKGVEVLGSGSDPIAQPDIEENLFGGASPTGLPTLGTGVWIRNASTGNSNVGGIIRSNNFERCDNGVYVESAGSTTAATIPFDTIFFSNRFSQITSRAIDLVLNQTVRASISITDCVALNCATGIRVSGLPLSGGAFGLEILKSAMRNCGTGLDVSMAAGAVAASTGVTIQTSDNVMQQCTTGIALGGGASSATVLLASLGDRILDCVTGASVNGTWNGGVAFDSDIFGGPGGTGIALNTSLPVHVRSTTIAGWPVGMNVTAVSAASQMHNNVFGSNSVHVGGAGAPAITWSCFQGLAYPGAGNLNANPQLVAPFYKLSVGSPCIDAGNPSLYLPSRDYEGDPRADISRLAGSALPDMGADEFVLAGSARSYGARGFGVYNVFPTIGAGSPTTPAGSLLAITLQNANMQSFPVTATFAFLVYGTTDDPAPLPFSLAAFGLTGSYLWNNALGTLPILAVNSGNATQVIPVPYNLNLVGGTFTFQWFTIMPAPYPAVTSDGLRVTIGR